MLLLLPLPQMRVLSCDDSDTVGDQSASPSVGMLQLTLHCTQLLIMFQLVGAAKLSRTLAWLTAPHVFVATTLQSAVMSVPQEPGTTRSTGHVIVDCGPTEKPVLVLLVFVAVPLHVSWTVGVHGHMRVSELTTIDAASGFVSCGDEMDEHTEQQMVSQRQVSSCPAMHCIASSASHQRLRLV